jgi:hypothetical protein
VFPLSHLSKLSIIMSSHIVSASHPLPPAFLQQLAIAGPLDEISNLTGAVRHHIFYHGRRDAATGKTRIPMLFFIYQTTRHGPQNGFRLCLVHQEFHIASESKVDGDPEDDIDRLEKAIPQGHMEMVILGDAPAPIIDDQDGGDAPAIIVDDQDECEAPATAVSGQDNDDVPATTIDDQDMDDGPATTIDGQDE